MSGLTPQNFVVRLHHMDPRYNETYVFADEPLGRSFLEALNHFDLSDNIVEITFSEVDWAAKTERRIATYSRVKSYA